MFDLLTMFGIFFVLEMPYMMILLWGVFLAHHKEKQYIAKRCPDVCIALTCYSEGDLIEMAIESIAHQDYVGRIIAMVLVDGGSKYNPKTVEAGYKMQTKYPELEIVIVDKDDRYGRVHSNNTALQYCMENNVEYLLILDGDTSISLNAISSFVLMMEHHNDYTALSGSIKVRNLHTMITKLSYIEYSLGLVLSRFGLSCLGYVNNVSGAFGFFRTFDVNKIGGWRPNSAEDYDLTLRSFMHKFKLGHCEKAIAYTDSPDSLTALFKQRWTWSGDLVFLLTKYYHYLIPENMGWKLWFFVWYNSLLALSIPFCLVLYTVIILSLHTLMNAIVIGLVIYIFYLYISIIMFIIYYNSCEEQKDIAWHVIFYLPLFPFYAYILRVNDVVAICNELFLRQHLSSKMAPKEVLLEAHHEENDKYIRLRQK
jgi:biofilm PGA synthesis N-glycosyltransferase PgaC